MVKRMIQLDLFSKHVIGGGLKLVNLVGTDSGYCLNDAKFEAIYKVEFQYVRIQIGIITEINNDMNQGWNKD